VSALEGVDRGEDAELIRKLRATLK
jgi:hypothetical protein